MTRCCMFAHEPLCIFFHTHLLVDSSGVSQSAALYAPFLINEIDTASKGVMSILQNNTILAFY